MTKRSRNTQQNTNHSKKNEWQSNLKNNAQGFVSQISEKTNYFRIENENEDIIV